MARETIKKTFRLPPSELLKNLIALDVGDLYFDLHNDYECYKLAYKADKKECRLSFKYLDSGSVSNPPFIDVIFVDATLQCCSLVLNEGSLDGLKTVDMFYRGRFETSDGLKELDGLGRGLYYIGFYEGIELEVFASGLILEF